VIAPAKSWVEPSLFERSNGPWPFAPLTPRAYSLIMIDCAWEFVTRSELGEGKSPQSHYATMTIDEISALPVRDLARDDCLLWMWATAPMLDVQMKIMTDAWGFRFFSSGVWVKTTKTGKIGFGTGYGFRNAHESILLGKRGNPQLISKSVRSVIMGPLREHSRKPDEAYAAARALVPYGRAADVYSRETRPGWEAFGNEVGKFSEAAE